MRQGITLDSAFELFLLDGKSRQFSEHTIRFYNGRLSLFLKWCESRNATHLHQITPHLIRRYLVDMQERKLSSAYIHSHARAIRTYLNYCVRDELITASPFDKVKMPLLEHPIKSALTAAEIGRILRACETERDRAIILFLLDSGVRSSELVALNRGDIDMDTGTITIRKGKMQRGRFAQIGIKARKQLMRYWAKERDQQPKPDEPAFVSERKKARLTYYGLAQALKRIRVRSGVKGCSPHNFRRTFALNCLRNGMDIFILARLMGHKDLTVLRGYLALVEDDLREAHGKHGVVDNLL